MDNKYFSVEKQQKALKWLEDKWPQEKRVCEICANTSWHLADDLVMPLPFSGSNLRLGGKSYPHILITCKNCGNAKCFNAVIMKIEVAI